MKKRLSIFLILYFVVSCGLKRIEGIWNILKKAIPLLKAQGYEFRRIEEKYGTAGKSEID